MDQEPSLFDQALMAAIQAALRRPEVAALVALELQTRCGGKTIPEMGQGEARRRRLELQTLCRRANAQY